MDVHSPKQRSFNMSRIRGKDTTPEIKVRLWLWSHRYRYRLFRKDLPGNPDLVFPGKHKIVFVNGCFWHMHNCTNFKMPATNIDFWRSKLEKNRERDKKNYLSLHRLGWKYRIVWECDLLKDENATMLYIKKFLDEH